MTPGVTAQRLTLAGNGYRPVPILTGEKFPTFRGWQNTAPDPERIRQWPAVHPGSSNTGIICGDVLGVDIDVSDQRLVSEIEFAALENFGASPLYRTGRAPRLLIVYRAAVAGIRLCRTPALLLNGETHQVEIRATGQQFVAFGGHPSGATYSWDSWSGLSPCDVPLADLPAVTPDDLAAFLAECERILRAAGATGAGGLSAQVIAGIEKSATYLAPPNAEAVIALLGNLPNPVDADRTRYVETMLAAVGCIAGLLAVGRIEDGDDEAIRDAAIGWAMRWEGGAPDYDAELTKWESDFSTRDRNLAGWRNLEARAKREIPGYSARAAAAEFGPLPAEQVVPASANPFDDWRSMLELTEKDTPRASPGNVLLALEHAPEWKGVIGLDEFRQAVFFVRRPWWRLDHDAPLPWPFADTDYVKVRQWLHREGIRASVTDTAEGIARVATENAYDVRDMSP